MKNLITFIITLIITVIMGMAVNVSAASAAETPFTSCHLYGEPGSWNEEYNDSNKVWHDNHMCSCYENVSIYSERYGFVVKTDKGVFTPACERIEIRINSIGDYEYYKGLRYVD